MLISPIVHRAVARVEQMRVQNENDVSERRRERSTAQKELDALRQRNSALEEQLKSAQQAVMSQSSRVSSVQTVDLQFIDAVSVPVMLASRNVRHMYE